MHAAARCVSSFVVLRLLLASICMLVCRRCPCASCVPLFLFGPAMLLALHEKSAAYVHVSACVFNRDFCAGVGSQTPVVVSSRDQFSAPARLVSYAAPTIRCVRLSVIFV